MATSNTTKYIVQYINGLSSHKGHLVKPLGQSVTSLQPRQGTTTMQVLTRSVRILIYLCSGGRNVTIDQVFHRCTKTPGT
ncbi:hypothetical protein FKM82_020519 [Ascaphus truei]